MLRLLQFSRQQHLLPNQDRAQSQRAYLRIRPDPSGSAEHLGAALWRDQSDAWRTHARGRRGASISIGAIIEYLEEVYPDPPLLPKDPVGRAQVRALADIVGSDMHPVNNLRIRNFIRDTYKAGFQRCE